MVRLLRTRSEDEPFETFETVFTPTAFVKMYGLKRRCTHVPCEDGSMLPPATTTTGKTKGASMQTGQGDLTCSESGERHTHTHQERERPGPQHTHQERERPGPQHTHTRRERDQDRNTHTRRERDQDRNTHTRRERDQDRNTHTRRERDNRDRVNQEVKPNTVRL